MVIAKTFWHAYKIWTTPIKKIRFIIPYFFKIPYKLIESILNVTQLLVKELFSLFNNKRKPECSGKGEKYKYEEGRSESTKTKDRKDEQVQQSMNWIVWKIKQKKILLAAQTIGTWKPLGQLCASPMDYDLERPNKFLTQEYKKLLKKSRSIDEESFCPGFHDMQKHNKKFE